MGRNKIEIKPLSKFSNINSTFKQRKNGLVNKAKELGTLCHAQVALIVFSQDGSKVLDVFVNGTFHDIVQRYGEYQQRKLRDEKLAILEPQVVEQPSMDHPTQPYGIVQGGETFDDFLMENDMNPCGDLQYLNTFIQDDIQHDSPDHVLQEQDYYIQNSSGQIQQNREQNIQNLEHNYAPFGYEAQVAGLAPLQHI